VKNNTDDTIQGLIYWPPKGWVLPWTSKCLNNTVPIHVYSCYYNHSLVLNHSSCSLLTLTIIILWFSVCLRFSSFNLSITIWCFSCSFFFLFDACDKLTNYTYSINTKAKLLVAMWTTPSKTSTMHHSGTWVSCRKSSATMATVQVLWRGTQRFTIRHMCNDTNTTTQDKTFYQLNTSLVFCRQMLTSWGKPGIHISQ